MRALQISIRHSIPLYCAPSNTLFTLRTMLASASVFVVNWLVIQVQPYY
jgi:hypothetical protein